MDSKLNEKGEEWRVLAGVWEAVMGWADRQSPAWLGFGVVTRSGVRLWEWVAGVEWNKRQLEKRAWVAERAGYGKAPPRGSWSHPAQWQETGCKGRSSGHGGVRRDEEKGRGLYGAGRHRLHRVDVLTRWVTVQGSGSDAGDQSTVDLPSWPFQTLCVRGLWEGVSRPDWREGQVSLKTRLAHFLLPRAVLWVLLACYLHGIIILL